MRLMWKKYTYKHTDMEQNERKQLYEKVINSWGVEHQLRLVEEEVGEMLTALAQRLRGRTDNAAVITELADVTIMMEQMALLFDWDGFWKEKEYKLQRLQERLEQHTPLEDSIDKKAREYALSVVSLHHDYDNYPDHKLTLERLSGYDLIEAFIAGFRARDFVAHKPKDDSAPSSL